MKEEDLQCLIERDDCGRRNGEPICAKCGMDSRVFYPSKEDRDAALALAQKRFLTSLAVPSVAKAFELERSGAFDQARDMLFDLAQRGESAAMHRLSQLFHYGHSGFKKDEAEFRKWLELAAGKGYPAALCDLARQLAAESDRPSAFDRLSQAKDLGSEEALVELAKWHLMASPYASAATGMGAADYTNATNCLKQLAAISKDWVALESHLDGILMAAFGADEVREQFSIDQLDSWLSSLDIHDPEISRPRTNPIRIGITLLKSDIGEETRSASISLEEFEQSLVKEVGKEVLASGLHQLAWDVKWKAIRRPRLSHMLFVRAAGLGHRRSIVETCTNLVAGNGLERDVPRAINSLKELASAGDAEAAFVLGEIHCSNELGYKDLIQAAKWYLVAESDSQCWWRLGAEYLHGEGPLKLPEKGIKLLTQAATQGFSHACLTLGYAYSLGRGVLVSEETGKFWFQKYIEYEEKWTERSWSAYKIAVGFDSGVNESSSLFFKWAEIAATEGCLEAAIGLAYVHQEVGVLPILRHYLNQSTWKSIKITPNPAVSLKWWLTAAERGDVQAAVACTYYYSMDLPSVRDVNSAMFWLERARSIASSKAKNPDIPYAALQMALLVQQGKVPAATFSTTDFWARTALEAGGYERLQYYIRHDQFNEFPIDIKVAILEIAAGTGDEGAMLDLGLLLLQDGMSHRADAAKWFDRYLQRSVETRDAKYHHRAAEAVVESIGGLPNWADYLDVALEWLGRAQQLGSSRAPFTLALLKNEGKIIGVDVDFKSMMKKAYTNALEIDKLDPDRGEVDRLRRFDRSLLRGIENPDYGSHLRELCEYSLAEAGSSKEQVLLAKRLSSDREDKPADLPESFFWTNEAAKQRDPEGLYRRGLYHLHGSGVQKNVERALADFREAAGLGSIDALLLLARVAMRNDLGIQPNVSEADRWLEKARAAGADFYGILNQFWDLKSDVPFSQLYFKWCTLGAEAGHAMESLAACYSSARGTAQDLAACDHWLEKWLDTQIQRSAENLGEHLTVEMWPHNWFARGSNDFAMNESQAFAWCRRLMKVQENPILLERIGDAHAFAFGVERNLPVAIQWWRKSAGDGKIGVGNYKAIAYQLHLDAGKSTPFAEELLRAASSVPGVTEWASLVRMILAMAGTPELSVAQAYSMLRECWSLSLAHEAFAKFCAEKPLVKSTLKLIKVHYGTAARIAEQSKKQGAFVGAAEVRRIDELATEAARLEPLTFWQSVTSRFK